MKKIEDSISKSIKPLKIYLEELSELHDFLLEIGNGKVKIQACGYELEDFGELENLPDDEIHSLEFTCTSPYVSVDFTPRSARIYCRDGDITSEGIVAHIYTILGHGQIKRLNLIDYWWISLFFAIPLEKRGQANNA